MTKVPRSGEMVDELKKNCVRFMIAQGMKDMSSLFTFSPIFISTPKAGAGAQQTQGAHAWVCLCIPPAE